ncbi:hypothetical protein Mapa_015243 [Marchantia paleacea]|nr:hypothetical protein Mapa_015243 [Marchantia paleacea]
MDRISFCLWTAVITLLCIDESLCATRDGVDVAGKKPDTASRGGIKTNLIELRGSDWPCLEEEEQHQQEHGDPRSAKGQDHDFRQRVGRNCASNYSTQSLYGPGNYLMQISLGTPPQKFTMIMDSRSDLVWVQCRPCTTCSMSYQVIFDPAMSSTFANVSCDDALCSNLVDRGCAQDVCSYQNKDDNNQLVAQGRFYRDTLSILAPGFVNLKVPEFGFGCSEQNIGLQVLQVDGIAGFGRGPISLISQVGAVYGDRFSYCLKRSMPNNGLLNNVGPSKLTIGDMAVPSKEDQKSKKVQWSPMLKNDGHPSFYVMNLQGISVNNKKLKAPGDSFKVEKQGKGGTLLDIGVKMSKFSQPIFKALTEAMDAAIDYKKYTESITKFKACYIVPGTDVPPKLPTVTMHFAGGVNVVLPADKVFMDVDSAPGNNGRIMCLAADATAQEFNVFGSAWQHGLGVIVDNERSKIGFIEGDCNAPPARRLRRRTQ